MRTADPDLADVIGPKTLKSSRVDNRDTFSRHRAPTATTDWESSVAGRCAHAMISKIATADDPRHMTRAARAAGNHDGRLRHSVERIHRTRVEAVRRKHAVEPLDGIGMYRFGRIDGDLP